MDKYKAYKGMDFYLTLDTPEPLDIGYGVVGDASELYVAFDQLGYIVETTFLGMHHILETEMETDACLEESFVIGLIEKHLGMDKSEKSLSDMWLEGYSAGEKAFRGK